ncbi:hypothetical protein OPIT5_21845 [Opitutaceae bacterium TAV5]|nr:hypothetical protein OPIT5_21845 [Opitutaceae bacterium TAV5]
MAGLCFGLRFRDGRSGGDGGGVIGAGSDDGDEFAVGAADVDGAEAAGAGEGVGASGRGDDVGDELVDLVFGVVAGSGAGVAAAGAWVRGAGGTPGVLTWKGGPPLTLAWSVGPAARIASACSRVSVAV